MSRIGKKPIDILKGVDLVVKGNTVTCKGPKGSMNLEISPGITVEVKDGKAVVGRTSDDRQVRMMHGTTRALIRNMVEGVGKGYSKKLEIQGVGFKAQLQGKKLSLSVGHANQLIVEIPQGVEVKLADPTHIEVIGIDRHLVGQTAATIRAQRKPEPYKGKGIRYEGEQVRRKAGKTSKK